jgi:DME family drug/metabolite transporter
MFGIVLALLSALSFGLSQILVRKKLNKSNFFHISLTITIMGNIIFWPFALTFTNLNTVNPAGLLLFIISGLLAPGIARLFYFKGMETAGISANASIFATYPLYTSITAILLLGETLTAENWIGVACIIVGGIFLGRSINKGDAQHKNTSKKSFIVPVLGSLAIAFSQIMRKEGLNIYNEPLLGTAVGYSISLIFYLLIWTSSSGIRTTRFSREDIKMFWKPGVGIAAGWLLSFLALSQEMVSIVVPILQTELLFILFFAYIFLRKLEKISYKIVTSALLIVVGVTLISIN